MLDIDVHNSASKQSSQIIHVTAMLTLVVNLNILNSLDWPQIGIPIVTIIMTTNMMVVLEIANWIKKRTV